MPKVGKKPVARQPAELTFEWVEAALSIPLLDGGTLKVHGLRFGPLLSVHLQADKNMKWHGKWVVTHVATGLACCRLKDCQAAMAVAEALACHECARALTKTSQPAVEANLPAWVKPWATACHERFEFLDPAPFKEANP